MVCVCVSHSAHIWNNIPISGEESARAMSDGSGSQTQVGSLHYGSLQNSLATLTSGAEDTPAISPRRAYAAIAVLCYVNLVNYIERYTIAGTRGRFLLGASRLVHSAPPSPTGILPHLQAYFAVSDSVAPLLQTGTPAAVAVGD